MSRVPGHSPRPTMPSSVSTSTIADVNPHERPKNQVSGWLNGTETTVTRTSPTLYIVASTPPRSLAEAPTYGGPGEVVKRSYLFCGRVAGREADGFLNARAGRLLRAGGGRQQRHRRGSRAPARR